MTSTDGMTADFYPFDMKFIGHVATRIVNEVKGVNRVVYDVTQQAARHDRVGVRVGVLRSAGEWGENSALEAMFSQQPFCRCMYMCIYRITLSLSI